MIRALFTPEAHDDPYVWASVLLAHSTICNVLTFGLMFWIDPLAAATVVSVLYLILWEGAQVVNSIRHGRQTVAGLWDGILDAVAVALGAFTIAVAAMWLLPQAVGGASAVLLLALVGAWRRS